MADDGFYFNDQYINVTQKGNVYELKFVNVPVGMDPKSLLLIYCEVRPCPKAAKERPSIIKQDEYIAIGLDKAGDYVVEFGSRPQGQEQRILKMTMYRDTF